jgi:hypothetical protein
LGGISKKRLMKFPVFVSLMTCFLVRQNERTISLFG